VLVLDMIEILPPLGKYKYETWRILPVKCYIDNSVRLRSCIRNINNGATRDRDCRAGELSSRGSHFPCGALTANVRELEASTVMAT
jgi:hypothetical protein